MALEPVEIPPDPVTEPQQKQEVTATPDTQQPSTEQDFLRFKVRGLQREIPSQEAERFAGYLGWKPDALVNRLQMATDAERIYGQLKRDREEFEQERQAFTAAQQQNEADRAARFQGRQQPQETDEDPIAYLRQIPRILERQEKIERQMQEERVAFAKELHRDREQQINQEIHGAYDSFIESKRSKNGKAPVYDLDTLVETAEFLGIDTVKAPVPRILEAAYRYLAAEELPQQAVEEQMRKLRDPRAAVVVPGSPSTQPVVPQQGDERTRLAEQLSGLKWGETVQFIPEIRR